jgi:hypothetical protein
LRFRYDNLDLIIGKCYGIFMSHTQNFEILGLSDAAPVDTTVTSIAVAEDRSLVENLDASLGHSLRAGPEVIIGIVAVTAALVKLGNLVVTRRTSPSSFLEDKPYK